MRGRPILSTKDVGIGTSKKEACRGRYCQGETMSEGACRRLMVGYKVHERKQPMSRSNPTSEGGQFLPAPRLACQRVYVQESC